LNRTVVRMRTRIHLALLLLLPALPLGAQARWKEIDTTATGNKVLLDPKSVSAKDGIITATLRTVFVKPVKTPKGDLTSARTTAMFDCAKGMVAVKENIYFHDEKANSIYQRSAPKIPGYAKPFDGALPAVAMRHLCATPAK
jgi:hypothetical protein